MENNTTIRFESNSKEKYVGGIDPFKLDEVGQSPFFITGKKYYDLNICFELPSYKGVHYMYKRFSDTEERWILEDAKGHKGIYNASKYRIDECFEIFFNKKDDRFLTEKDIESEGWERIPGGMQDPSNDKNFVHTFGKNIEKGLYRLNINQDQYIVIYKWTSCGGTHTIFEGFCYSTCDFKNIIKFFNL